MKQAIVTKFYPATNNKSSRIKAQCTRGKVFIDWDDALDIDKNHTQAVQTLINKFVDEDFKKYGTPKLNNPWRGKFISGSLPDGTQAHVFV